MILWELVLCDATAEGYKCKVKKTFTSFKKAKDQALALADRLCMIRHFLCFYFEDVIDEHSLPDNVIIATAPNSFYVAVRRKEVIT